MLDHVSLRVSDYERSEAFYDIALSPLGLRRLAGGAGFAGYGETRPFFWIGAAAAAGYAHVAFVAESREMVEAFHRAALDAGGTENGAPGLRPHYHPGYYGAFVLDPDGHNVEAVFHEAR
jgi:catechol 2,3-dioxygenase-like lactoylglutathione lyase family enzyme